MTTAATNLLMFILVWSWSRGSSGSSGGGSSSSSSDSTSISASASASASGGHQHPPTQLDFQVSDSHRLTPDGTGAIVVLPPGPEPPPWEEWVRQHRSAGYHDGAAEADRRSIYAAEAAAVRAHNARASVGLETYTASVNEWSDLAADEWATVVGLRGREGQVLLQQQQQGASNVTWLPERADGTPTSLDWRLRGAVTGVKNQGGCGACWSFGATGTMEGAWYLAGHRLESLSEEQLIHCSGQGCGGGNPGHAIDYVVKNHGIDSERDYKYTAKNGKCDGAKAGRHVAAMSKVVNVPQQNEKQLLAAVSRQPVAVAIDAVHGGFRSYHRGVLGGKCGTKIDHSVLVVGFGVELLPPPPPPGPTISCARPTSVLGCFDINGTIVLPTARSKDHDRVTLENCALQCEGVNLTVAGVDAGNHCRCGSVQDISNATARGLSRPLAQCHAMNCTGAKQEQCGGTYRLLAYAINCTVTPPPLQPGPPPPPRELPYCKPSATACLAVLN